MEGKLIIYFVSLPFNLSVQGLHYQGRSREKSKELLLTGFFQSLQKKLQPSLSTMGMCLLDHQIPEATILSSEVAADSSRQVVIIGRVLTFIADRC